VRVLRRRLSALAAVALTAALLGCAADAEPGTQPSGEETTVSSSDAVPTGSDGPSGAAAEIDEYVAMGDSYTAAPLFPLEDDLVIDDCLRSESNYPTLVADSLDIDVVDVSCSGASTTSILSPQRFTTKSQPAQIDALEADADLVTIGIGANDFTFFSQMIFDCLSVADRDVQGAPCREANTNARGRDDLHRNLSKIRTNVERVVGAIAERAPEARIVLIGYPQIIPSEGTCRARLPLAIGDYAYTRDLNLRLAEAVRKGGTAAGAEYVDLVAASQGHDICAEEPWVAGIRGKDNRAAGLHPYPAEQEAVADLLLALL
jgi:lysophospholipase L1-like esterase